jgi:aminoglycoside phosphotransferase (APT) family kinase protein
MNDNDPTQPEPTIDTARLGAWMDTVGLAPGAPITARYVSGGSQNEIFEIRRGDFHAALRKPPAGAPESRNDGILREWRITEALTGTDVPHTEAYAVCTDPSVLGGTFYLMGFVDGWSRWVAACPSSSPIAKYRGLAFEPRSVAEMARSLAGKGSQDLAVPTATTSARWSAGCASTTA